jgi:hypothetical protein
LPHNIRANEVKNDEWSNFQLKHILRMLSG